MALNVGIVDHSIIGRGARESKIDLATPVNIYTTMRENARKQKLSELTLSKEEREQKRQAELQGIIQGSLTPDGHINSEKAIAGLNRGGFLNEAAVIQDRYQKAAEARRKAMEDSAKDMSSTFLSVAESKNPAEAFLLAKEDGQRKGWKMSRGLMEYTPSDEDIATGKINPKVLQELLYHGEKSLTPEQRIARAKEPPGGLSEKDRLEEERRKRGEALSEEFRQIMLPNIKVGGLATDKNARNALVKDILSSKYWDTPLAKQVIQELKSPSEDIGAQLAKALTMANVAETRLTGDEEKGLSALEPAVADMNKLVKMYRAGSTGSAADAAASAGSRLPFVGQRLFKSAAEFGKHKDIMAERFLRAATGAAAPAEEVSTYRGFLPEWGDTPEQAQTAINSFMSNVRAKAVQSVSRLRLMGTPQAIAKADLIEKNIDAMLLKVEPIKEAPVNVGKWKKVN